jgi:transcription antitermination factor NusA-like protein
MLESIFEALNPVKLFKLKSLYLSKKRFEVGDKVNVKVTDLEKNDAGDFEIAELEGNLSNTIFKVTLIEIKTGLRYSFEIK